MKKLLIAAAAAAAALTASAPAHAWSPGRIACIRAAGYQPADWDARRVPAGPAAQYRACRAKADERDAARAK